MTSGFATFRGSINRKLRKWRSGRQAGEEAAASGRSAELTPEAPFRGLAAFEERDVGYFFGRAVATADMLRLVERNPLTLLMGASGLGKTSLLGAGIFPELSKRDFFPVNVRLEYATAERSLAESIIDQIVAKSKRVEVEIEEVRLSRLDGEPADDQTQQAVRQTLWGFLTQSRFWSKTNHLLTPVLVLDQFEELFTIGRDDPRSEPLVSELADAIQYHRPESLGDAVRAGKLEIPPVPEPLRLKCIVALREDFLPDLELVQRQLPGLASSRYRLGRFNVEEAVEAVCRPSPELVTREVALGIFEYLAKENRARLAARNRPAPSGRLSEVEPALLSLFCYGLNKRRLAERRPQLDEKLAADSQGLIVHDFYEDSIRDVGKAARAFVETLISDSGFRTTVAKSTALHQGVDEESISLLVNRRLLRLEDRFGQPHVELIHDVLTTEVLENKTRRQKRAATRRITLGAVILATSLIGGWALFNEREYDALMTDFDAAGAGGRSSDCETLNAAAHGRARFRRQELSRQYAACLAATRRTALEVEARAFYDGRKTDQALIRWAEAAVQGGQKIFTLPRDWQGAAEAWQRLELTLRGDWQPPLNVAIGADSIYSLGKDGIRVWATSSGNLRNVLVPPDLVPRKLFLRRSNETEVLVALLDRINGQQSKSTVMLWNPGVAGDSPRRIDFKGWWYVDADASPDGMELVAAAPRGLARISLAAAPKANVLGTAGAAEGRFNRVTFDPAEARVLGVGVSPAESNMAVAWPANLAGPALFRLGLQTALEPDQTISNAALVPGADLALFALSTGQIVELGRGTAARRTINETYASVSALATCPGDGRYLYAAVRPAQKKESGALVRIDLKDKHVETLFTLSGATVGAASLSKDCSRLVSAWNDRTVRVILTGAELPFARSPVEALTELRRRLGYTNVDGNKTIFPLLVEPAPSKLPTQD